MKSASLSLIAASIGLLIVPGAEAEVFVGDSVEWLAASSSVVCFAQPLSFQRGDAADRHLRQSKVTFKVTERLYGPSEKDDIISVYDLAYSDKSPIDWNEAIRLKEPVLLLAIIAKHTRSEVDGRYIFSRQGERLSVFTTGMKISDLYRPDSGIVSDYAEVVERCRGETTKRIDHEHRYLSVEQSTVEAVFGSEAHKRLYHRSWCGIFVPKYVKPH